MKRQEEIQRILEDFKRIKNISGIKSAKRKVLITKIKNEKGEVITSRKGIANVFGEFYSKLHDEDQHDETEMESDKNETENEEITKKAVERLKIGKAADTNESEPKT